MRTSNFPAKKNARRVVALDSLGVAKRHGEERKTLLARLDSNARDKRTKIDRSGTGRFW